MWADLHYPDDNGVTNFERLSQLEKQTGQPHIPDMQIPVDAMYIWEWFMDLHGSRQSGFGISPISYLEIQAWKELKKLAPTPWEIETIKRIDVKVVNKLNELNKRRSSKGSNVGKAQRIM